MNNAQRLPSLSTLPDSVKNYLHNVDKFFTELSTVDDNFMNNRIIRENVNEALHSIVTFKNEYNSDYPIINFKNSITRFYSLIVANEHLYNVNRVLSDKISDFEVYLYFNNN